MDKYSIKCLESHVVEGNARGAEAIAAGRTVLESSWAIVDEGGQEIDATGRDKDGNPTGLRFSVCGYADAAAGEKMAQDRAKEILEARGLTKTEPAQPHPTMRTLIALETDKVIG